MSEPVRNGVSKAVIAVSVVVMAGAVVRAVIPDGAGVIHGCYQNNNGSLRVVDNPATCKNNETALAWSQSGPQGPMGLQGPEGPQGQQGPQGTPGPGGVSGWEINRLDINLPDGDPGTGQIWTVPCSAGKRVLGGGVTTSDFRDSVVRWSGPNAAGTLWSVHIQQTSEGGDTTAHLYAICASV